MNIASRMMTSCDTQCIQISRQVISRIHTFTHLFQILLPLLSFSTTKNLLSDNYLVEERGKIIVKGKGEMATYWIKSKFNRLSPLKNEVNKTEHYPALSDCCLKKKIYSNCFLFYLGFGQCANDEFHSKEI